MNYHNILHDNMLNGEGLRVVLFVSGCTHKCYNCQNPQTHDFNSGIQFDKTAIDEIFDELSHPYIKGLTISGGDPLHPKNLDDVYLLCQIVKKYFPTKDIWVYTGYTYENLTLEQQKCLKYIDVLVDGEYVEELKDINKPYVGSTNQRILKKFKGVNDDEIFKNQ